MKGHLVIVQFYVAIFLFGSLSTGDGDDKVFVRANRERIFVDGNAFIKAKIVFSVNEPVYFWRLTQTFKIDEILSDADIGMFWVATIWIRFSKYLIVTDTSH